MRLTISGDMSVAAAAAVTLFRGGCRAKERLTPIYAEYRVRSHNESPTNARGDKWSRGGVPVVPCHSTFRVRTTLFSRCMVNSAHTWWWWWWWYYAGTRDGGGRYFQRLYLYSLALLFCCCYCQHQIVLKYDAGRFFAAATAAASVTYHIVPYQLQTMDQRTKAWKLLLLLLFGCENMFKPLPLTMMNWIPEHGILIAIAINNIIIKLSFYGVITNK